MPPINATNDTAASENGVEYEILIERRPEGMVRRFFATLKQFLGLLLGGAYQFVHRSRETGDGNSLIIFILQILVILTWVFVDRELARRPFSTQFRVRLERLGPTYIKLGQILSLREDLLPRSLTDELKNLLDRLPAVTFERYKELIENSLMRPVEEMFAWIGTRPLGSASLAQTHQARLHTGERVVIKVLKPNVRKTIISDTRLMRFFGFFAQLFFGRYQPKRLISEFCRYTVLEVDLRNEANNAETFAVNFLDEPDINFPTIYRQFSNADVLCMEFFEGSKPDAALVARLSPEQIEKVIDLGVGAAIQMIFRDGFFHADLHPGNMVVFEDGSVGFIDLGMVGRFDNEMQKKMLYYFYSLVADDPSNAARYLVSMTIPGRDSDPDGFRRAVEDLNGRWMRSPNFEDFSLGQLVLQSISLAARYHIQYPGEIILMIKTLVTVEGVGNVLAPGIDVVGAARKHVQKILFSRFDLKKLGRDSILVLPELLDVMYSLPFVLGEGLRFAENQLKSTRDNPLLEIRGTIFASFCMLAGAIVLAAGGSIFIWGGLFFIAFTIGGYTWLSK